MLNLALYGQIQQTTNRQYFTDFSTDFSQKVGLTIHANCFLRRQLILKPIYLKKIRNNIFRMFSPEIFTQHDNS